jgi:hypothetical protein
MNNKQKVELIVLIVERLQEHIYDLAQNNDLVTAREDNQDLMEVIESLDHGCQLLEIINQPMFEHDKKLILL